MTCRDCPGCGQFCDYPYCEGVPRPAPPDPEVNKAIALEWAASWSERNTNFLLESGLANHAG